MADDLTLNSIQFNVTGVMDALKNYFVGVMQKAEEKTVETMQKELGISGGGPRDASDRIKKWKDSISQEIKVLYREIAQDYIESTIGVSDTNDEIYRKAIIIAVGGGPDYAGPEGRSVWDEDYSGMTVSQVEDEHKLPATWKLKGNQWMDNAAKKITVYFYDLLDASIAALPSDIFSGNVIVS